MTLNAGPPAAETEERPNDFTGLILLVLAVGALGVFAGWSWAFIVVAIIFMIFMHEMGHFVTAKLTGMKVTEFFIGFGPRIWSFHRGETEYGVKLIPAGAYVRIIGMNNLDPVEPGDEDRAYRVKSFPRKLLVVTAGSLMHFVMAVVLIFAFLVWQGVPTDDDGWQIANVSDQSAAAELGLRPGDRVLSLDGVEVGGFSEFGELVSQRGGRDVEVVYERGGDTFTDSVVLGARLSDIGDDAVSGLGALDRILEIDGTPVFGWDDVVAVVGDRVGEPLRVVFDPARDTEIRVLDNAVFLELPPAEEATIGFFGVGPEATRESLGLFGSITESVSLFVDGFGQVLNGFYETVTSGALPTFVGDTLSGEVDTVHDDITSTDAEEREAASRALDEGNPEEQRIISIYGAAQIGSQVAEDGLENALQLLAFLNISIGILNLIPLPPLDGGHVAIATYERLRSFGGRRHEVDYNKVLPVTYAVFVLLTGFGLLAIFRDIIDPINIG